MDKCEGSGAQVEHFIKTFLQSLQVNDPEQWHVEQKSHPTQSSHQIAGSNLGQQACIASLSPIDCLLGPSPHF